MQRAQGLERDPLLVGCARDHVDQIDIVTNLGHRRAGDRGVQDRGDRRRTNAELARLVLVDADADLPRGLHPIVIDVARARLGPDHGREIEGDPADLVFVRPGHAILQRPADRGTQLERGDARDDIGKLLGEGLLELRLQPLARVNVLSDDHELREERIGELDVERQDEPDRAAADVGAVVVDLRVILQERLEALRLLLGRKDRSILPKRHIDRQLGPVGRREKLSRHKPHQEDRRGERSNRQADG